MTTHFPFQSLEKVEDFMMSDPDKTFEEYCAESMKYVEISREIPSKLEGTITIGMFRMQRNDLISSFRGAATRLANKLLKRMMEDFQIQIRTLVRLVFFVKLLLDVLIYSYKVFCLHLVFISPDEIILRQDLFTITTPSQMYLLR